MPIKREPPFAEGPVSGPFLIPKEHHHDHDCESEEFR